MWERGAEFWTLQIYGVEVVSRGRDVKLRNACRIARFRLVESPRKASFEQGDANSKPTASVQSKDGIPISPANYHELLHPSAA